MISFLPDNHAIDSGSATFRTHKRFGVRGPVPTCAFASPARDRARGNNWPPVPGKTYHARGCEATAITDGGQNIAHLEYNNEAQNEFCR